MDEDQKRIKKVLMGIVIDRGVTPRDRIEAAKAFLGFVVHEACMSCDHDDDDEKWR